MMTVTVRTTTTKKKMTVTTATATTTPRGGPRALTTRKRPSGTVSLRGWETLPLTPIAGSEPDGVGVYQRLSLLPDSDWWSADPDKNLDGELGLLPD
jgi:hypothetical protein